MLGLASTDADAPPARSSSGSWSRRVARTVMRSRGVHIPKYELPIRIRPWFVGFTVFVMLLLGFLGFTNFSHALPLNDKLLHFLCFMLATAVFYFIWDVEDDARRIWYWRHGSLMFTGLVCFFFGGIVSEFVQSMLPFKVFQFGDIVANILGSSFGLYVAYHLEKYYRHRREINRLYRPLDADYVSDDEGEGEGEGRDVSLLPMHYVPTGAASPKPTTPTSKDPRRGRRDDVWDEREEIFGVGDESDDEHSPAARSPYMRSPAPRA